MKSIYISCIFLFYLTIPAIGRDFSEPDKVKHIEYSEKATFYTRKLIQYPLMITRPLKHITGEKIYMIFPENYLPQMIAAPVVFAATSFKEFPVDFILPNRHASLNDIRANCKGIKKGLYKNSIK